MTKTNLLLLTCFLILLALALQSCKPSPKSPPAPTKDFVWQGEMTINEPFLVDTAGSLTILPGSKITFEPGASIITRGDLIIKGTPEQRIQLICKNPPSNHRMIKLYNNHKKLHIHHADIQDGLITAYMSDSHFKDVSFSNSRVLEWNDAMVRIFKSRILIEDCVANWNNQGEGILIHKSENPIIRNCTFNKLADAVELLHVKRGLISNCRFNFNRDDSVDFNHCFKTRVENSVFINTYGCALELGSQGMGSSDSLEVDNCLFVDCRIALHLKESSMIQLSNSTFLNNGTSIDLHSHKDSTKHTTAYISNSLMKGGINLLSEKDGAIAVFKNTVIDRSVNRKDATVLNFNITLTDEGDYIIDSKDSLVLEKVNGLGYKKRR